MVKLNLGCGPHAMDGWTNYDIHPYPRVMAMDLSGGILPHGDNSVDYVFSEHFIEHLTKDEGVRLMRECYRVLKPDGVLRLSTPDLSEVIRAYTDDQVPLIPGVWEPKSACDFVNEGMRSWGHQYLYDKDEMTKCLVDAGFLGVWDCYKGNSVHVMLRDLEVRPCYVEMYIEATKYSIRR